MLKNIFSVKDLRISRELTEFEVAKVLNITPALYRQREKHPALLKFGEIETLANLFGVSFSDMWELVELQAAAARRSNSRSHG